ncbi:hypothetical protein H4R33_006773 [Dimargaris cristalligena]|nr:hypothetical protein H4R33_006773 [Dimargaris cristalligena]
MSLPLEDPHVVEKLLADHSEPAPRGHHRWGLPNFWPRLPAYTGPHKVGCHDIEWPKTGVAQSIEGLDLTQFKAKFGAARIYYPAQPKGNEKRPSWLPDPPTLYARGYLSYAKLPEWLGYPLASAVMPYAKLGAFIDAPLSDGRLPPPPSTTYEEPGTQSQSSVEEEGEAPGPAQPYQFPLVIFSHGMASCRTTYSMICGELASYGFVVVVPEHTDGSANMSHSAHQTIPFHRKPEGVDDYAFHHNQLLYRVSEIEETLRLLERVQREGGEEEEEEKLPGSTTSAARSAEGGFRLADLHRRLDFGNVVYASHSFGSATILESLGIFPRLVRAALILDPWMLPVDRKKPMPTVPMIIINSENFTKWEENYAEKLIPYIREAQAARRRHRKPKSPPGEKEDSKGEGEEEDGPPPESLLITVLTSEHMNQSDLPVLLHDLTQWLQWVRRSPMPVPPRINPYRCLQLNSRAMLTFMAGHLDERVAQTLPRDPNILSSDDKSRPPEIRIEERF